jgi:hypothetical protein
MSNWAAGLMRPGSSWGSPRKGPPTAWYTGPQPLAIMATTNAMSAQPLSMRVIGRPMIAAASTCAPRGASGTHRLNARELLADLQSLGEQVAVLPHAIEHLARSEAHPAGAAAADRLGQLVK